MSVDIDALMAQFDNELSDRKSVTKVGGRTVTRKGGRTARTAAEEAAQLASSTESVKVQHKTVIGQDANGADIVRIMSGEETGQRAAARLLTAVNGYLCDHNGQPVQPTPAPEQQPQPAAQHVNGTAQKGAARKGNGNGQTSTTAQVSANVQ